MVTPVSFNHVFTRGDDYSVSITFTNTAGAAQNISAWTSIAAQIREDPDSDTYASFTISTAGAASGILVLSLSATATQTIPRVAVWDSRRVSSGALQTVVTGHVFASEDVTQP